MGQGVTVSVYLHPDANLVLSVCAVRTGVAPTGAGVEVLRIYLPLKLGDRAWTGNLLKKWRLL